MTELYSGYRQRQEEKTRREAFIQKRAAAFAVAVEDWTATRDRLADNPVASACLDLHRPALSYQVQCATCIDPYGHGGDGETWPCMNYHVIREAER
jgi:hypothetical protein